MSNLVTLTNQLAERFGMEAGNELSNTLKATCFNSGTPVTDAQMTALLIVANQYGLNPFTKEIFAFPDKDKIVPVVGVDGWSRIINDHPQLDGIEFEQDNESCTCKIYRKDRKHPVSVTEYMSECYRPPFKNKSGYEVKGPWQSHPKRMLRHKALIQCSRLAFGYSGIYDQDEAERIVEPERNMGPAVQVDDEKYQQYEADVLPLLQDAAKQGTAHLQEVFKELGKSAHKAALWERHSEALKQAAAQADQPTVIDGETGEIQQ